ncbi:MAG: hypothetical protein ABR586_09860, partial [Thermoplasmatota archaeon]
MDNLTKQSKGKTRTLRGTVPFLAGILLLAVLPFAHADPAPTEFLVPAGTTIVAAGHIAAATVLIQGTLQAAAGDLVIDAGQFT